MAYDPNSLARTGYVPFSAGISKSAFQYATGDTRAQVLAANYFNADYKRFDQGDSIMVTYGIGGTLGTMALVVTSAKGAATVTVTEFGQSTLTDNTGGTAGTTLAATAAKQLLTVPIAAFADIANAAVYKVTPGFRFKVTGVRLRPVKPVTTAAKAATLTTQISGVATTGGVISATSAGLGTAGTAQAGTAITALNTGSATDTLELAASAVTAFSEGNGYAEFDVINLDLADALASLNAS